MRNTQPLLSGYSQNWKFRIFYVVFSANAEPETITANKFSSSTVSYCHRLPPSTVSLVVMTTLSNLYSAGVPLATSHSYGRSPIQSSPLSRWLESHSTDRTRCVKNRFFFFFFYHCSRSEIAEQCGDLQSHAAEFNSQLRALHATSHSMITIIEDVSITVLFIFSFFLYLQLASVVEAEKLRAMETRASLKRVDAHKDRDAQQLQVHAVIASHPIIRL